MEEQKGIAMTKDQYTKRFRELTAQISNLQKEYIANHELKVGDDVLVGGEERRGQITSMDANWRYEAIDIRVKAYKKDGTLGNSSISTGYGEKIVKL